MLNFTLFFIKTSMAMNLFSLFLVFFSAHGFLLDKTQRTSGPSGKSNQYVTFSDCFGETKTRQSEDQLLHRYVDNALAVLTSQLEHKFDALDQKFLSGENESVSSQAYASLEQKYTDLERKHTDLDRKHTNLDRKLTELDGKYTDLDRKYMDLERKYSQLQSMNKELNLIKSQFVSIQNKPSENNNNIYILKQLGNIKPLQEIQTLQQAVQTVSAQTHSLSVNERARGQDFLALYNITIEQKAALSALNTSSADQLMKLRELETNNSKQLLRLRELETNTSKQLLRLGQNHNSTTASIISKMEEMEKQENRTMSVMQNQINKNSVRVAITASPSTGGTITSNTIINSMMSSLVKVSPTSCHTKTRESLLVNRKDCISYQLL